VKNRALRQRLLEYERMVALAAKERRATLAKRPWRLSPRPRYYENRRPLLSFQRENAEHAFAAAVDSAKRAFYHFPNGEAETAP
jgi:hypothetical protein